MPPKVKIYRKGKGLLVMVVVQTMGKRTVREEKGEVAHRHGTAHDILNLMRAFENVDKDIMEMMDPTGEEIESFSGDVQLRLNEISYDWFVYACSAHGNEGVIYGSDGEAVEIEDHIFSPFSNVQCPTMGPKPKIFIINACRGDGTNALIPDVVPGFAKDDTGPQIKVLSRKKVKLVPKHKMSDRYVIYSAPPGMFSERDQKAGSPLLVTLKECMADYDGETHFKDITQDVATNMMDNYQLQIQIDDMLSRRFYLPLAKESSK